VELHAGRLPHITHHLHQLSRTSLRHLTYSTARVLQLDMLHRTQCKWLDSPFPVKVLVRISSYQQARLHLLTCITAVVDEVSANMLTSPVSGLLGLGWQSLASSGQMPLWQTLASGNAWSSALFAVQFTR
jgi:hypothetical protein